MNDQMINTCSITMNSPSLFVSNQFLWVDRAVDEVIVAAFTVTGTRKIKGCTINANIRIKESLVNHFLMRPSLALCGNMSMQVRKTIFSNHARYANYIQHHTLTATGSNIIWLVLLDIVPHVWWPELSVMFGSNFSKI